MKLFVFVQNDPFYLPVLLDRVLEAHHGQTAGIEVLSIAQGSRGRAGTALALWRIYGFRYFLRKLRGYFWRRFVGLVVNRLLRRYGTCYSVAAVGRKYGLPVSSGNDVNSGGFRAKLVELGTELVVSISGTEFYKKELREQTPKGIINCHGGLLPRYRGLMPSFWGLANGEKEGGVTVHFVDAKLDNGPILVQRRFPIHEHDTLEAVMKRSKELAAECIIEAIRLVEAGDYDLQENDATQATHFGMPTRDDAKRLLAHGHRFY